MFDLARVHGSGTLNKLFTRREISVNNVKGIIYVIGFADGNDTAAASEKTCSEFPRSSIRRL